MIASGQATITYGYDDANQLRTITQGSHIVSFDYDAAGRRTEATLPNGIVVSYSYDVASQLIGIDYFYQDEGGVYVLENSGDSIPISYPDQALTTPESETPFPSPPACDSASPA